MFQRRELHYGAIAKRCSSDTLSQLHRYFVLVFETVLNQNSFTVSCLFCESICYDVVSRLGYFS